MKTITLTAAHEHDGCEHPAGTELVLTETDASWLIGVGKTKADVATSRNMSVSTQAKATTPKAAEFNQDKELQA